MFTTMKKIYQIPAVRVTRILTETVVATSLTVDASKTTESQYVKEDVTSQQHYSVWDDDWSN